MLIGAYDPGKVNNAFTFKNTELPEAEQYYDCLHTGFNSIDDAIAYVHRHREKFENLDHMLIEEQSICSIFAVRDYSVALYVELKHIMKHGIVHWVRPCVYKKKLTGLATKSYSSNKTAATSQGVTKARGGSLLALLKDRGHHPSIYNHFGDCALMTAYWIANKLT